MIDLERIRQQPTAKRIILEFLINVLPFLFLLYGLKCIVTSHGAIPVSVRGTVYRSWYLKPVGGAAAVMTGLACMGFGLFVYFSDGQPPNENRVWLWRILRAVVRWGGLIAAFWCFNAASEFAGFQRPTDLDAASFRLLLKVIGFILGVVGLLWFLIAMFQREAVKRDLSERGWSPSHIWWRPAAYWNPWINNWGATGFRVIFSDEKGSVHKAYCIVYRSFLKDPRWGSRRVKWLKHTVVSPVPIML